MASGATTTKKTTAAGKAFLKRVEELKKYPHVDIGLPENVGKNPAKDSPLTIAELGTFHEFGTVNIPERSFIRSNDAENHAKYVKMLDEIRHKIFFDQWTTRRGLGVLGEAIQRDIKARMIAGEIQPQLASSTIEARARKSGGIAGTAPLIDTGQLVNSIRYQIFEKGKK